MVWRKGEGSKRRERMEAWVSEGRVGRVEAGGRDWGRSMVSVVGFGRSDDDSGRSSGLELERAECCDVLM